jgi:hypothetical protein
MASAAADGVSLLDLPRPFLRQLLDEVDWESARCLICASRSSLQLLFDLKPAAVAVWGRATGQRLNTLLQLGGLGALFLPDSRADCQVAPDVQLQGLQVAVLNYRCGVCI